MSRQSGSCLIVQMLTPSHTSPNNLAISTATHFSIGHTTITSFGTWAYAFPCSLHVNSCCLSNSLSCVCFIFHMISAFLAVSYLQPAFQPCLQSFYLSLSTCYPPPLQYAHLFSFDTEQHYHFAYDSTSPYFVNSPCSSILHMLF